MLEKQYRLAGWKAAIDALSAEIERLHEELDDMADIQAASLGRARRFLRRKADELEIDSSRIVGTGFARTQA